MSLEIILFEKAIRKVNSILKRTGLHLLSENNDKSFMARIRRRWFFCVAIIWYLSDFAAELAWFIDGAFQGKGLIELTYPAPAIATCLLANIKTYYFLKHEPTVNNLIRILKELQSLNASDKIRGHVEKELKGRMTFLGRAINVQYVLSVLALAGFAVLPFIVMALTYFETGKIELFLPYVGSFPFDVYDIRIWPFVYLHQMWSAYTVVFMVLGTDSLYYACCTFIQIQFRFLHYDLERIISRENAADIYDFSNKFALCMTRHTQLIRCVKLMEQIYSKSTLFNVVTSSMLICLTGFNVTALPSWPVMMPFVGFVCMVSSQIFLFCYFGDIIMRSSFALSDAVYNCQWYNADASAKRNLLFVLVRSQTPCKLTAWGFSVINLNTFTRILSTAWSYFALLSTMNTSRSNV